jgi:hypothetical protein
MSEKQLCFLMKNSIALAEPSNAEAICLKN